MLTTATGPDTALHMARYPYMFDCEPLPLNPRFKSALRRDLKRKLRDPDADVYAWGAPPSLYNFIPIRLRGPPSFSSFPVDFSS
jgi:hypothetical protein